MTKQRQLFSCDLETTTNPDDCRVWGWGYRELYNPTNIKIGNNFDEFMDWLLKSNANIYFHNLRFDGHFIVNWLLRNGFTHTQERKLLPMEFSTIISNMGQWYTITVCLKKGKKTKIMDSLKKLPFTVEKIGKDFGLSVLKGKIDYDKERPVGYELDENERAYLINDIEIIAQALEMQFNDGLKKLTNGSDALHGFTELNKSKFEKLYPVLDLELNDELRRAYRGGFTWTNPRFQGQEIGQGRVYDVNSLYSSVMYNKPLPCGHPEYYEGEYKPTRSYPLYIQKIRFDFELKEGHIPTIQLKNTRYGFKDTDYLISSEGKGIEMYVSSVDWELIKDHYHIIDVTYLHGYMFRTTNQPFKAYIDKWMERKNKLKGAPKANAKLMLNSLYGKFATNPDVTGKIPYMKDDEILRFKEGDKSFRDPIYTPVGVFTTAYAREITIRTAQKNFDRILYCDTDSIHLEGLDIPDIDISDSKLGAWKHEGAFKRAKFLRAKTYVEDYYVNENGNCEPHESTGTHLDVKCAGMNDAIKKKVTFDNFSVGFTSMGKLKPKAVKHGVILEDTPFTIK